MPGKSLEVVLWIIDRNRPASEMGRIQEPGQSKGPFEVYSAPSIVGLLSGSWLPSSFNHSYSPLA